MTYRPYDAIISSLESFNVKSNLLNNSGLTILQHMPVRLTATGDIAAVDVSDESHVLRIVGISEAMIITGAYGVVVTQGKIENISSFSFGDYVYISKTGGLTNVLPSAGVGGFTAGDWVVRIGVIGKNEDDPLLKDLFLNMHIVGQL